MEVRSSVGITTRAAYESSSPTKEELFQWAYDHGMDPLAYITKHVVNSGGSTGNNGGGSSDGVVIDLNCPITSDTHTCDHTTYGEVNPTYLSFTNFFVLLFF